MFLLFLKHLELMSVSCYFCYLLCSSVTSCHLFAPFCHFVLFTSLHPLLSLFISLISSPSSLTALFAPLFPPLSHVQGNIERWRKSLPDFQDICPPLPHLLYKSPTRPPPLSHRPQKSVHSDKMLLKRRLLSLSMASHYLVQKRRLVVCMCVCVCCNKCVTQSEVMGRACNGAVMSLFARLCPHHRDYKSDLLCHSAHDFM